MICETSAGVAAEFQNINDLNLQMYCPWDKVSTYKTLCAGVAALAKNEPPTFGSSPSPFLQQCFATLVWFARFEIEDEVDGHAVKRMLRGAPAVRTRYAAAQAMATRGEQHQYGFLNELVLYGHVLAGAQLKKVGEWSDAIWKPCCSTSASTRPAEIPLSASAQKRAKNNAEADAELDDLFAV